MTTDPITTGSTIAFGITAFKGGVVLDLTAAAVTFRLIDRDGAYTDHAATVTDGPNGAAQYTTLTTDIAATGTWQRQWRVVVGGLTLWSKRRPFEVVQGG